MKGRAAWLLVLLAITIAPTLQTYIKPEKWNSNESVEKTPEAVDKTSAASEVVAKEIVATSTKVPPSTSTPGIIAPGGILLEDFKSIDESANNEKIQEEIAKVVKAQSKKTKSVGSKSNSIQKSSSPKITIPNNKHIYNSTDAQTLKAILKHGDAVYNEDLDDDDDELDDDDEYDDDEDEDEEDEDEDEDDDNNDDEEVVSDCPDYCRCVGAYAAATTAKCSKLNEDQVFGSSIGHLKIENAGDIRLGPHILRKLGLRQLESLTIVDTKIVELDRTAFEGLRELFVVNLTRNGLNFIHPDTFQHNSQLSLLTISGNPLRLVPRRAPDSNGSRTTPIEYLFDAPSVAELDLCGNQLSRLPRRAFAKMKNLAYINLKRNRLRTVERELFAPLDQLVELDLSQNLLSDLPSDLFKGKGLQTLKLAGNILSTLSSVRAPKLTTLDASMNQLKTIAKEDLAGLPYLDRLDLSSNNLRRIHQHAFSNLDQLTLLDLSNNNLMALNESHLKANSRLQVLSLSDNPELESLPIFRTAGEQFNKYSIYRFECENCGLLFIEPGTFDAMPAISRLNLARNQLSDLPNGLLKSLSSLRELDLSMNRIDKLDDDIFEGATSLSKLSLAMNSFINGLPVTPFLNTPNLSRLDLSYCGLQKIWSNTSVPFDSLRFLSLHKNRLSHIKVEELRVMPKLSDLDISRNPLKCDGELSAAIQWLTDHSVTPAESFHVVGAVKVHDRYDGYDETVNQWTDLAKRLCDKWDEGPVPRPVPRKPTKKPVIGIDDSSFSMPPPFIRDFGRIKWDIPTNNELDHGQGHNENEMDSQDYDEDLETIENIRYHQWWYSEAFWPAVTIVLMLLGALLVAAHLAVYLAKRRGRGPVIRRPMILRPGFVDNKNCGLVYKPLQEEIVTPHMPKRSSFYSSSTFHYDKIVPESV